MLPVICRRGDGMIAYVEKDSTKVGDQVSLEVWTRSQAPGSKSERACVMMASRVQKVRPSPNHPEWMRLDEIEF